MSDAPEGVKERDETMSPESQFSPENDRDADLMMQAATGSQDAFAEIVRRHQNGLLNFFVRMGAYGDEEDLVQETFVRVYKYRNRYRPSARFKTFLYVVARHTWADRGRKAMRREGLDASLQTDARIEDAAPDAADSAGMDMREALERLSPKLREVLVLNVYQGMRYQEVADVLGVPLGTVKSRINLALQELRKLFDEDHR
jgi:RNA polymerase sigma-70 factor, ECF subfamily